MSEFHPVSEIFPLMTGAAFDELVADIRAHGLREPIWVYCGKIIDGRNRFLACERADVEPTFREWDGTGDLTRFVVSLNLHRRHLNESQRAMVAAKIATRPRGRNTKSDSTSSGNSPMSEATTADVAELLQVNETTIREAKRVQRQGSPEVIAAVEAGSVSLHLAEKVICLPKEEQPLALAREKLMKGKRSGRFSTDPTGFTKMAKHDSNGNGTGSVRVSIDTSDAGAAAASLAAALETEFLEKLAEELSALVARTKVALSRGMGPARKGT